MDHIIKGSLLRESVALEAEAAIPTASSEVIIPTVVADEPEVSMVDIPMELTQPLSFFALTQDNYQPK